MRYFNWNFIGIIRHQFIAVLQQWIVSPRKSIFESKFYHTSPFNVMSAWFYKIFVSMYAEILERTDNFQLLKTLDEPELGNPFIIHHKGRRISQDLCNSIHEFYSILGHGRYLPESNSFCEIGAGYGRLANVILRTIPNVKYCIIDIQPALSVSERYLTTLFPDLPTFKFRSFDSYTSIAHEFETARIQFLSPEQTELIPKKSFDYFISISSLHEMTKAQVTDYFNLIHLLCRGHFYTKQWKVSRAQINDCTFNEHDYPVPSTWQTIYHRQHPIQRMFFHALYKVT